MPELNRSASTPAAGATRDSIKGLLGILAADYVSRKTGNAEFGALVGAAVIGAIGYLGKWLRDYAASKGATMHATL